MALVGTRDIIGQQVEVHADEYGRWTIRSDDEVIGSSAESLDKAVADARNALNRRKVKVEVPFFTTRGQRGVATGLHGRNRTVRTRIDDRSEQLQMYVNVFTADIPQENLDRIAAIAEEVATLGDEQRKLSQGYVASIGTLVEDAITAAQEEPSRVDAVGSL